MTNFLERIGEKNLLRIRKYFFLGVAILGVILTAVTAVTPFLEYIDYIFMEREAVTPISTLGILQNSTGEIDGVVYIGLAVFTVIISITGVELLFLGKGVLSFFYAENKLAKNAKVIVILTTILTGCYYLSGIIVCGILSKMGAWVFAVDNSAPFVLALIADFIYSVAVAFLNKASVQTTELEEAEDVKEKKSAWIRKGILLGLAAVSSLMVVFLLNTPFCIYYGRTTFKYVELLPKEIRLFLREGVDVTNNILYCSLISFSLITVAIVIVIMLFSKCVVQFFTNEKKLLKAVKTIIVFSAVFCGAYFVGSMITCVVLYLTGSDIYSASNVLPFIISLLVAVGYAVMLGIHHKRYLEQVSSEGNTQEEKTKRRKNKAIMYRARAELFICVIIIAAFSFVALLTNIVMVTFDELPFFHIDPISISGLALLRDYLTLDAGSQTIAFIIMLLLALVGAFFFFVLIAFLSRSNTFYKLALAAVSICTVVTFLVGMFGKYYQIVQKLNEGMLSENIRQLIGSTDAIKFGLNYKVTSKSLYYSLASLATIIYLLFRNPYTKGITMEREFARLQESENPHTITGEISLKEVPEELTKLNDGTVVSVDRTTGEQKVMFADPCPVFTELDQKRPLFSEELEEKQKALFESPTLPKLVQFIVQYARDCRLHLSYTEEDIATFVAGLGTTKLTILQGMSGTGKTSLPKIFAEALHARCEIIEVESSWRDKNELLGYYNEFSKNFTPKKFTQALYRAKLNPETLTFIVLDEMNLSRIEYYFSDFLSLMENEPDKRELRLLNVSISRTEEGEKISYAGLSEGHTIKIPSNIWFVGTANRDESTFEISDKVYDRAHTMNFNKRAAKVLYYNEPIAKRFLPVDILENLFEEAKRTVNFNIDNYPIIKEVEKLLAPYNISFGNRIALQIENFVNVYSSCFVASEEVIHSAVERILLSKVVSKLELKSVDNKELLATEFEKLNLRSCSEFILKLNED